MAIDPKAVGATTEPMLFQWTDRDTLLYALGVGAGLDDLSFTTENSHESTSRCYRRTRRFAARRSARPARSDRNWAMLLHGSQGIRLHAPLPAAGSFGGHRGATFRTRARARTRSSCCAAEVAIPTPGH